MKSQTKAICTLGVALLALVAACPDKKPKYPTCAGDKDCQAGEHCVDKKCVQCGDDTHCEKGQTCVDGACVKKLGCDTDADCADGKLCKQNQCVTCSDDAECGADGRCVDGGCLKPGACRKNDDCPGDDEDCVNGLCRKADFAKDPAGGGLPSCVLEPIFFGYDQYAIPDEAKPALQKNADCLATNTIKIAVIGHTDDRGPDEYNIGLSDDRAQSVITYLARLGVEPERMRKVPKGEGEATGNDEAGWQKDRRVEFSWE
jgi:peptidoglycan-associated lipoprotein